MDNNQWKQFLNEGKNLIKEQFKVDYKLTSKSSNSDINRFIKDIEVFRKRQRIHSSLIKLLIKALKQGVVIIEVGPSKQFNTGTGPAHQYRYFYWKFKNGVYDPDDISSMKDDLIKAIK